MDIRILEKLEWPTLAGILADLAQTEEGRRKCLELEPELKQEAIESRWADVVPLRDLSRAGYRAPIGLLVPLYPVFKAASVGHSLTGSDLRAVYDLQISVKKVFAFASDLQNRCITLRRIKGQLYTLPNLLLAIEKAVAPDGSLLDTASEELQQIRRHKISLRKRIEESIKKLLHEAEVEQYLQDDFFTVRSDRYVIPMRLDGRGRLKGAIIDTSDSGQTLFLEPSSIQPLNEQLLELDVAEKLEILRIFRELTEQVATDLETLRQNYAELISLNFLTAQATLAANLDAGPVRLVDKPGLGLRGARHPLIRDVESPTRFKSTAIPNNIELKPLQNCLVISGPNAGGKTVVLKTVGILQIMAKAGLLLPADENSELYLFDRIFLEMGDAQNLQANLSTFSGHIHGLKPILEKSKASDLALLDELAVGTEPETGSAIAQAVLENLSQRGVTCLATTHYDSLKGLAIAKPAFRNGSMEYSLKSVKPTYKLVLDVPGQSYGLEVAAQIGLPAEIVDRARMLRGSSGSALDAAVTQLMEARDEVRIQSDLARQAALKAEGERARWEDECRLLDETRRKVAKQLAEKYEDQMATLREQFDEVTQKLRQAAKETNQDADGARQKILSDRQLATQTLREMERTVQGIAASASGADNLPGRAATAEDIQSGAKVYVIPLRQEGQVIKPAEKSDDPIEVQVGIVKLRVSMHDLRVATSGSTPTPSTTTRGKGPAKQDAKVGANAKESPLETPKLVLQTATNACDLRGFDVDQALDKAFTFIDKALLRGEAAVVLIHGHGTDRLKHAIRRALKESCPYDVTFRPGEANEGGDGVTIVGLRN